SLARRHRRPADLPGRFICCYCVTAPMLPGLLERRTRARLMFQDDYFAKADFTRDGLMPFAERFATVPLSMPLALTASYSCGLSMCSIALGAFVGRPCHRPCRARGSSSRLRRPIAKFRR